MVARNKAECEHQMHGSGYGKKPRLAQVRFRRSGKDQSMQSTMEIKNPTSVGSAIKEAGKDREKAVVVRPK
jgi:hypothetical protein